MLSLALLIILAAYPSQIASFLPDMVSLKLITIKNKFNFENSFTKGDNIVEISDIFPDCVPVGAITYTTKVRKIKYTNHASAVINVTRPVGPLGVSFS